MSARLLPPRLIEAHGVKLCSACLQTFDADSSPSIISAFNTHVLEVHRHKEEAEQDGAEAKTDQAG
jgi:hypothetical protein